MQAAGLDNVGRQRKQFPDWPAEREDCDGCHLRGAKACADPVELETGSGCWTCAECNKRGLPCSWTVMELSLKEIKTLSKKNNIPAQYGTIANGVRALLRLLQIDEVSSSRETGQLVSERVKSGDVDDETADTEQTELTSEEEEQKIRESDAAWDESLE